MQIEKDLQEELNIFSCNPSLSFPTRILKQNFSSTQIVHL